MIKTRTYTIKKSEGYKIPSIGLIRSWKVITNQNDTDTQTHLIPTLLINDIRIDLPKKNQYVISIPEIRDYIKTTDDYDMYIQDCLQNIEILLFSHQINAIQYYPTLSNKDFFESIFTKDISVKLVFKTKDTPEEILIEEEYYDRKTL